MILVIIHQPGNKPRFVAFADELDFIIFATHFKSDYAVQYIEDGRSVAAKLESDNIPDFVDDECASENS